MKDEHKTSESNNHAQVPPTSENPELINLSPQQPVIEEQFQNARREMTGFERATLRWAKLAFLAAALAAIFIGFQWNEMRSGSKDTHDLAVAAKAQADSTKAVAEHALAQVNATKDTASATKDIAVRTLRQAEATNRLATQAKRSADISDNALLTTQELANLERRPWIGFNFIDNTTESGGYILATLIGTIANTGKTPAVDMDRRVFMTFRYNFDDNNVDIDRISKDYYSRPGLEFPSLGPIIIDNIIDKTSNNREIIKLDEYGAIIRVVPPNSIREFKIMQGDKFKLTGRRRIDPYQRKGVYIYIVGDIVYYDTSRANKYMTNFCIKRDFEDDSSIFTPCPFGNDMK